MTELAHHFEFSVLENHVRITCSGIMDKSAYLVLIPLLEAGEARWNGITRYLVDISGASHKLTVLDQYELAALAAEKLPRLKVATLVKNDLLLTGLYENAANNRGLKTLVIGDEEKALAWLLKD
jgi:hypothetical protein